MSKVQIAFKVLMALKAPRLLDAYWGAERLTVLAYHRIADPTAPGFKYDPPVVSATPEKFALQMAYIREHFNVVDLEAVNTFLHHGRSLPPRPLLITFDDGYLDNYTHAYPVLKRHGFPAVIFLLTSRMDNPLPAWWDECAHYFHHTQRQAATLPLIGERDLSSPALRRAAREALVRQLKRIPEAEKLAALRQTGEALQVDPPGPDPDLFMTWDHVRELVSAGIACQPHTVNHPILARVDEETQRCEIVGSCERIREETGQTISAFAYPNGGVGDYTATTMRLLQQAGIRTAFTLLAGPVRPQVARQHPLEIPRVYLGGRDTVERFVFKVMGLPALMERPRFIGQAVV